MDSTWTIAGTEKTYEYSVVMKSHLGFAAYRVLDPGARYRIRVEPHPNATDEVGLSLTPSLGWKQPSPSGLARFSFVAHRANVVTALEQAINALKPDYETTLVNPSNTRWIARTVAFFGRFRSHFPRESRIFISYSHKDKKWLQVIKTWLKPALPSGIIWDDTAIQPGAKWRSEIEDALEHATIAILLVSSDFMASDFIMNDELPPILQAQELKGLSILWIPVRYSNFEHTLLADYQALHSPTEPLDSLKKTDRERALVEITKKIVSLAQKKTHDTGTVEQAPLKAHVARKIDDFVHEGDSFSAFDVTQALRTEGIDAQHKAVKPFVHVAMKQLVNNKRYRTVSVNNQYINYVQI